MDRWTTIGVFLAVTLALMFLCAAKGAPLPDTVTRDKVTYARRGSLGADSYVATNVVVDPPGYQLSRVADMKLRDRAVNFAAVEGTNAVFALPGRKSAAGYARAFILYLDVSAEGGAAVSFTGAVSTGRPSMSANICVHTFDRAAPPARRMQSGGVWRVASSLSRCSLWQNTMPSYTLLTRCARVCPTFSPMKLPMALGCTLLPIRNGWNRGTKASGGNAATQAFISS